MPDYRTLPLDIRHNVDAQRFEATVDGKLCRVDYRRTGDVMAVHHTEVHPSLEGRGIAAALVDATFEYARNHGLRVAPHCSYVRTYVHRHPETRELLA